MPEATEIVDVVVGVKGPTSDISLFRNQQQKFDAEQSFKSDKAYIGGRNISTPHKKPRNGNLTAEQTENKVFASKRIFVEHIIRVIKIFRVASEKFCLHLHTYEQVIFTMRGLVRLRIGSLILPDLSYSLKTGVLWINYRFFSGLYYQATVSSPHYSVDSGFH